MLTVEKIGGTSMSQFGEVFRNIIKKPADRDFRYGRVFVVSAYAGVTDLLLENKKTGVPGIYHLFIKGESYEAGMDGLLAELVRLNEGFVSLGLNLAACNAYIAERIEKTKTYLASMDDVLASGYVERDSIWRAARELLASIGEAHSAYNSVDILRSGGVKAELVDLTGFHDPHHVTIDERISRSFANVNPHAAILIATGYTKGTEGIMREFDRGYSEITFAKVAVELKADEAVIHKEYHLSSADPKIVGVDKAVPVGRTNYDVADQLADIGMEAIHPKASKPLEQANINLRIKNTFEPDHPGTLISKDYVGPESKIEIIAGSDKVVVVEVHDSSMVGEVGFDLSIMETFRSFRISYILKSTNANSISLVIWEKQCADAFLAELRSRYQLVTVIQAAQVCVIGSNIAKPGIMARASNILAQNGINIECVSQSLRQVNIQFVITRSQFAKAVACLNTELCIKG